MTVDSQSNKIPFHSYDWKQLPSKTLSREGVEVDLTGDKWRLLMVGSDSNVLDFRRIKNKRLAWALKAYAIHRIERVSLSAGKNAFDNVLRDFLLGGTGFDHNDDPDFRFAYVLFVEAELFKAKKEHKLYRYYEAVQWYIWCAEHYPEVGFCTVFSQELEAMTIPGGPKGEAVRSADPEAGPLHRKLELPLIIEALRSDDSSLYSHVQQRAAVALALAFGRNPLNLVYLWKSDFEDITPTAPERCYVVHMPRIKKRQLKARDDRKTEYLVPEFARYIFALISRNQQFDVAVDIEGKKYHLNRPLFLATSPNVFFLEKMRYQEAFYVTSAFITDLIKEFVWRHNIISPITGRPLQISSRRLRYTLATNLAAEGISKRELAVILDHSDTQHVNVYFDESVHIVAQLDKAGARHLSDVVSYFKGEILESNNNAEFVEKRLTFYPNAVPIKDIDIGECGKKQICHLDPPYSCYLCPKFRPYRNADHDFVLECLLDNRKRMLNDPEKARLGIQLDDVIAAVAEVAKLCGQ